MCLKHHKKDYYKRIEKAIVFIECNLKNDICLDDIAEAACFSKYHFLRVFTSLVGETVWDYLRKRRITMASKELLVTNKSIIDLAIEYQFNSQEAFTRSFKSVYHVTPGQYRKFSIDQIAFGRSRLNSKRLYHIKNSIIGPRIVDVQVLKFIGIKTKTSIANSTIVELWREFLPRIKEIKTKKNNMFYEITPFDKAFKDNSFTVSSVFEKMAAVEVTSFDVIPQGMDFQSLDPGKYLVFNHIGSIHNIQLTYDFIYGTWLPNSDYQIDFRDSFEAYNDSFEGPDDNKSETEIWIPVK